MLYNLSYQNLEINITLSLKLKSNVTEIYLCGTKLSCPKEFENIPCLCVMTAVQ